MCAKDYLAFEEVLQQALHNRPMRLLAFCAMRTHWHLVVWPTQDGELPRFMHWLTCTHAQRWHASHGTSGTGAIYQGRYKAIPVKTDRHFITVCRYVERNALRAGLVERAEQWPWSSLWRRVNHLAHPMRTGWPLDVGETWVDQVNAPQSPSEVDRIRTAIVRGVPLGDSKWRRRTARRLDLTDGLRNLGRPGVGRPVLPM